VSWEPLNLAAPEYDAKTLPPDHLGIVYRGRRHVVSGPPESAKTILAWIFALEDVRGGGTVAAIDFEMGPHATRELLENLGWTPDEIEGVYYVEPDGAPTTGALLSLIDAGVTFTIIDSAAGAFDAAELDDNSRKDAQKFARGWIDPLWRHGITTVLIDHVVKKADNRGMYAIGSERKVGTADVHIGLETVKTLSRGGSGVVKVRVHKDRFGWLPRSSAGELVLQSDAETHAVTWELKPATSTSSENGWKPTALMEKVSRYLEAQTEPVSRAAVERANLGKRVEHIRQAMDALIADGYASEQIGSRSARLLTSTRPYRTSSDLVPTSSDEVDLTSSTSSHPYRGTRTGTKTRDEVTSPDEVGDDDRPFPILGDDMYPLLLADAAEAGHTTEAEFEATLARHHRIVQALEANHG
jgi:hypothetical protein